MALTKVRGAGAEGLTLSSTALTVANGLTLTDGNVTLASGHGIDFSATGDGSGSSQVELLDDYEEGSWTATAVQGISGFTTTSAKYAKVGRFVFVQCFLSSFSGKDSNRVSIGGLPYTVESNAYSSVIFESGSSGDFGLVRCQPDATYMELFKFNNSSHHRENFDGNSLGSHLIFGLGYVTSG